MSATRVRSDYQTRYTVFDIYDEEERPISVFPENFIDLNIMCLKRLSGGVPPDELFFLTDLSRNDVTFLIMSNIDSWYRWSKNQMLD